MRDVGRDLKTLMSWSAESLPGLTQDEIAYRMNTTQQTVSRWRTGKVIPSLDRISALAEVLELDEQELMAAYAAEAKKRSERPQLRSLSDMEDRLSAVEAGLAEALTLLREIAKQGRTTKGRKTHE